MLFFGTDDDNDDEKCRPLRHDRRRIRTPFCDDNAVQFAVSASSSEKAENSDIFTVSSDSFLDADVNDTVTVTTAKSRLSADSRISAEDEGSMSDETTGNNETDWRCRSSLRKFKCFYSFHFIYFNLSNINIVYILL